MQRPLHSKTKLKEQKKSVRDEFKKEVTNRLRQIYHHLDHEEIEKVTESVMTLVKDYQNYCGEQLTHWRQANKRPIESQATSFLITYGDHIKDESLNPLEALTEVLKSHFTDLVDTVHILPFYPWSSDRGFSVKDYFKISEDIGRWDQVNELGRSFYLMFDFVANHMSSQGDWFQKFLKGEKEFQNYFLAFDEEPEGAEHTFRPRTSSLFMDWQTATGKKYIWSTFSRDQVDLNYRHPDVFLKATEILLFYIRQGADAIRLDAIGFLWKELGTNSFHRDETHKIIKLWRFILDECAANVTLVSETNVRHEENISYFGNGKDEAQMVYNFSLPPLTLHGFLKGTSRYLTKWAREIILPEGGQCFFFNFLDSHDGIGVMGARGILAEQQIEELATEVKRRGGQVSMKSLGDKEIPYELNCTWWSALCDPEEDSFELKLQRFLAARFIALVFPGVPAIYLASFFGRENDQELFEQSGIKRDLNRSSFSKDWIEDKLRDKSSKEAKVFAGMKQLLELKKSHKAFHPSEPFEVLSLSDHIFALTRGEREEKVLALVNMTKADAEIELPSEFSGQPFKLEPYQFKILTK